MTDTRTKDQHLFGPPVEVTSSAGTPTVQPTSESLCPKCGQPAESRITRKGNLIICDRCKEAHEIRRAPAARRTSERVFCKKWLCYAPVAGCQCATCQGEREQKAADIAAPRTSWQPLSSDERCGALGCDRPPGHEGRHMVRAQMARELPTSDEWWQQRGYVLAYPGCPDAWRVKHEDMPPLTSKTRCDYGTEGCDRVGEHMVCVTHKPDSVTSDQYRCAVHGEGPCACRQPASDAQFIECDTCRAKPGSPTLCAGCLHNRAVINFLTQRATLTSNPACSLGKPWADCMAHVLDGELLCSWSDCPGPIRQIPPASNPPPSQQFGAEEIIARAYCRLQAADVPRGTWHWEVSSILATGQAVQADVATAIPPCPHCRAPLNDGFGHLVGCPADGD